jgi:hypothetical protein
MRRSPAGITVPLLAALSIALGACSGIHANLEGEDSYSAQIAKRRTGSAEVSHGDYLLDPALPQSKKLFLTTASDDDPEVAVSPKKPWGDFAIEAEETKSRRQPWWAQVLLWVPNRVLDLLDVVKLDVGAGMSFGAVGRITKYGQFGYRSISPLSVRVGLFGRRLPVLLEHSSEFGIGPGFIESNERKVCKGELGAGADLFIVGAYGGLCVDELLDFVAGVFFLDVSGDDLK